MLVFCFVSFLSQGESFISRSTKVISRISSSQQNLRMSVNENQIKGFDIPSNQKLIVLSAASMAICLLPGVAGADDGSMAIARVIAPVLDTFIFAMNFLFVSRTVISWYPKTDLTKLPFSAIVWPTEPFLVPVREFVPPAFGVDVSAIVWISLLSFLHECLTGQQGILTLLEKT